jgi:Transcriptional repressor TCF25
VYPWTNVSQKLIERVAEHRSLETCGTRVPISRTTFSRQGRNYAFCRSKKSASFQNIHSPRVCQFFVPSQFGISDRSAASSDDLAEESLLHLLSHIYVQRSHALWKDPTRSSWFAETVTELVRTGQLPPKATATAGFARLQSLVRRSGNFDVSIYRHVVVLGPSAQRLLPFIPAHIINKNNLACDPLPPPSFKSQYNDEFFRGAEDALATTFRRRSAAQTQRVLEQMVPDPGFRRQLQVSW